MLNWQRQFSAILCILTFAYCKNTWNYDKNEVSTGKCGHIADRYSLEGDGSDFLVSAPWSVKISLYKQNFTLNDKKCAGTMVTNFLILTDGECLMKSVFKTIGYDKSGKYFVIDICTYIPDKQWHPFPWCGTYVISHISFQPGGNYALAHLQDSLEPLRMYHEPVCHKVNLSLKPGDEIIIYGWAKGAFSSLRFMFQRLTILPGEECEEKWKEKHHPKIVPYENAYCAAVNKNNKHSNCIYYNGVVKRRIDTHYFAGFGSEFLTPIRENSCIEGTTYFIRIIGNNTYAWIKQNNICGPMKFTCANGQCRNLSCICNHVFECADKSDEDPRMCLGYIPQTGVWTLLDTLILSAIAIVVFTLGFCFLYVLKKRRRISAIEESQGLLEENPQRNCEDNTNIEALGNASNSENSSISEASGNSDNTPGIKYHGSEGSKEDNPPTDDDFHICSHLPRDPPWPYNSKYSPICEIGRGSYGIVRKSTSAVNFEFVAIKENDLATMLSLGWTEDNINEEAQNLGVIRNEHVIRIYESWAEGPNGIKPVAELVREMKTKTKCYGDFKGSVDCRWRYSNYLVLELCHGNLRNWLNVQDAIEKRLEHNILDIFSQFVDGLQALYKAGIIHGDLHPQNLLYKVNSDGKLIWKIADFGISKRKKLIETEGSSTITKICGLYMYRSPESLGLTRTADGIKIHSRKTDVYSLGLIFMEILFPAFCKQDLKGDSFNSVRDCRSTDSELIFNSLCLGKAELKENFRKLNVILPNCEDVIHTICKMLIRDPNHRVNATEIDFTFGSDSS